MHRQLETARGAILGALIGDAAGATLEFIGHKPSAAEVDHAMTLPGGGCWGVAPGQVTDDGEMALALCQALTGHKTFPADQVALNYVRWYQSPPFDIGGTTHNALRNHRTDTHSLASAMLMQAAAKNMASKANGSLMRASPLGVWAAKVTMQEAVEAARLDAQLTHPNLTCQWAAAAYALAIRHLMFHPGQGDGAFEVAHDAVRGQTDEGAQEVLSWLEDARSGKLPDFHPQAGFVRIGFTHAFSHLLRQTPYKAALKETLEGGGDTDTNACIVGGLLGALHGYSNLPEQMVRQVLNCNTRQGRARPEWLQTTRVLELIDALEVQDASIA